MHQLLFELGMMNSSASLALGSVCVATFFFGVGSREFAGHFLEMGLATISIFLALIVAGAVGTEASSFGVALISATAGVAAFVLGYALRTYRLRLEMRS